MARPLRIVHPGVWYHLTARGIERRPIFLDNRDRLHFLELLAEWVDRFALTLHAYVLMNNHYHLLISLSRPNLSRAVQWLNVSYSVWFNRRHRRAGYLFQGRFKSIIVDPQSWGLGMSAYIHLNPVRIGRMGLSKTDRQRDRAGAGARPDAQTIQRRVQRLHNYRWSSYPAYIGKATPPPWLNCHDVLAMGGGTIRDRPANYRLYVENQIRQGLLRQPWEELHAQALLGEPAFISKLRNALQKAVTNKSLGPRWLKNAVPWKDVVAAVERANGGSWNTFCNRYGHTGRDMALWLARRTTGLTLRELTALSGVANPANISIAVRRYENKIQKDANERARAQRAAKMLNVAL
jgi:REP element-mobilizing transposase RayT